MSFRASSAEVTLRPDYEAMVNDALTNPGKLNERYSAFWNYSSANQWLAMIQLGRAEPISTFPGWKAVGRNVKKGAKAIELLMPIFKKVKDETTGEGTVDSLISFMPKRAWFGLHQTEGEEYQPVVPGFDMSKAIAGLDIAVEPFKIVNGNCQGYARTDQRIIAISPIAFDPLKTTAHEVAHVLLHAGLNSIHSSENIPKDVREVEAELTAYLVKSMLGQTDELHYSRGYIQHWIQSDTKEKLRYGRVFSAVDDILRAGRIEAAPARPTPVSGTSVHQVSVA